MNLQVHGAALSDSIHQSSYFKRLSPTRKGSVEELLNNDDERTEIIESGQTKTDHYPMTKPLDMYDNVVRTSKRPNTEESTNAKRIKSGPIVPIPFLEDLPEAIPEKLLLKRKHDL